MTKTTLLTFGDHPKYRIVKETGGNRFDEPWTKWTIEQNYSGIWEILCTVKQEMGEAALRGNRTAELTIKGQSKLPAVVIIKLFDILEGKGE